MRVFLARNAKSCHEKFPWIEGMRRSDPVLSSGSLQFAMKDGAARCSPSSAAPVWGLAVEVLQPPVANAGIMPCIIEKIGVDNFATLSPHSRMVAVNSTM